MRKPADIASAHVAVGALLLMTTWVIAMRAIGVVWRAEPHDRAKADFQYAAVNE
jgi:hypothetical protein